MEMQKNSEYIAPKPTLNGIKMELTMATYEPEYAVKLSSQEKVKFNEELMGKLLELKGKIEEIITELTQRIDLMKKMDEKYKELLKKQSIIEKIFSKKKEEVTSDFLQTEDVKDLEEAEKIKKEIEKKIEDLKTQIPVYELDSDEGIFNQIKKWDFTDDDFIFRNMDTISKLKTITPEIAELFTRFRGRLELPNITEIDEETAGHLAKHVGRINLSGLEGLNKQTAEKLCIHEDGVHDGGFIFSITEFEEGVIELISLTKGPLYLSGDALDEEVAKILSTHDGSLTFYSLIKFPKGVAEHLSKHKGDLHLSSLEFLEDSDAEFLSRHKGGLIDLRGVIDIHEKGIVSLSKINQDDLLVNSILQEKINKIRENNK